MIAPNAPHVPSIPIATGGAGSAAAAMSEVRALEEGAQSGALSARLAPDAQVFRSRQPRGAGAAAPAAMAAMEVNYRLLRAEASAAGDMVMTLGEARWQRDGADVQSIYARVWQRRADGWRIVFDQLIVPRPPPPPG